MISRKKKKKKNNLRRFKLAIVKSKLLKQLSNNYPNFLKKDLEKFTNIILNEIKRALKRGDRVELRDIFTIEPRTQKSGFRRNPKNGARFFAKEKKKIQFKNIKWVNNLKKFKNFHQYLLLMNFLTHYQLSNL